MPAGFGEMCPGTCEARQIVISAQRSINLEFDSNTLVLSPRHKMRNRLVVSPHLTFRFEDGAPLLCLPGRPDMRADAATVMLVSQFACAREPDDFQSVLALVEIGALISADRLDAKESSDRSTQTDFAETQRAFGALAVALYRVAGELSVFGPDLHADIAEETGIPIRARLAALQDHAGGSSQGVAEPSRCVCGAATCRTRRESRRDRAAIASWGRSAPVGWLDQYGRSSSRVRFRRALEHAIPGWHGPIRVSVSSPRTPLLSR